MDLWATHLRHALTARECLQDRSEQFLDIQFEDVVEDPLAVIVRIYDYFGIALGNDARQRMEAFMAANPRGQFGSHRYSLEDFGLDREAEKPLFAAYCERFRVPESTGA